MGQFDLFACNLYIATNYYYYCWRLCRRRRRYCCCCCYMSPIQFHFPRYLKHFANLECISIYICAPFSFSSVFISVLLVLSFHFVPSALMQFAFAFNNCEINSTVTALWKWLSEKEKKIETLWKWTQELRMRERGGNIGISMRISV